MRSLAIAAITGLVSATMMTELEFEFIRYIATFNKTYATKEEYNFRLTQFAIKYQEMGIHAKDTTATY
jgi:hypothetical protein